MQKMLHYTVHGSGSPVLFLHGIIASHFYWDSVISKVKKDHRIITIDLLGFGDSPKPRNVEYTVDDHLSYLVATLESIGMKEPLTVVGHSMGAVLAVSFAKKYPQYVKNLVLISMPVYKDESEAKTVITGSKIIPRLMYYGPTARITCEIMCHVKPVVQRIIPHILTAIPKQVAIDTTKHTWVSFSKSLKNVIENQNIVHILESVMIPVLFIYGSRDVVARSTYVDTLIQSNDRFRLVRLEGTHQIPIENPKQVAKLIF